MALPSIKNSVGMAVTAVADAGVGTITLGAALSGGYQTAATAYGANANIDIRIEEGDTWEVCRDCTYTHSGTTVTRGTLEDGSSGTSTRVAFTSAAKVYVVESAERLTMMLQSADESVAWKTDVSITTDTTLTTTALGKWHVCTGTSANYTVTLPAAASCTGRMIGFRMSSALTKFVTIDGNAAETIDGVAKRVMWAKETALIYCDGTAWAKVAGKSVPMVAKMSKSTNTTVSNTTITKININECRLDNTGQMCDTGAYEIVIRRSGIYEGITQLSASGAAITGSQNRLVKDESTILSLASTGLDAASSFVVPSVISVNLGDTLQLYAYHATGSSKDYYGASGDDSQSLTIKEVITW